MSKPDAWFALVLKSMSVADIKEAIAEETDAQKLQWLRAELKKRS